MTFQRYIYAKVLIILSVWWGWTVLIDFFVIPTVFRTVTSFFEAGELGIVVFSKLNNLELIASSALIALLSIQVVKNRKGFVMLGMAVILWIIAVTYFSFLTPKIAELTYLWNKADLAGQVGAGGIPDIQQAHQYYHRIYVGIDTIKLIILTVMITFGVIRKEKWA